MLGKGRVNPFMHNVVKWPNILQISCGENTARILKYVWPFYNIMHEGVNKVFLLIFISKKMVTNMKLAFTNVPFRHILACVYQKLFRFKKVITVRLAYIS